MAGRAKLADRRGIDRVCALAVWVAGLALLPAGGPRPLNAARQGARTKELIVGAQIRLG